MLKNNNKNTVDNVTNQKLFVKRVFTKLEHFCESSRDFYLTLLYTSATVIVFFC